MFANSFLEEWSEEENLYLRVKEVELSACSERINRERVSLLIREWGKKQCI